MQIWLYLYEKIASIEINIYILMAFGIYYSRYPYSRVTNIDNRSLGIINILLHG